MQRKSHVSVNNIISADKSGCFYYRLKFPASMCECKASDVIRMNYLDLYCCDQSFFKFASCNILQRQVTDLQRKYFMDYIVPVSKQNHSWILYSIDDPLSGDAIPKYNRAWSQYQNPNDQENIKKMLNASDFVLVTTQELAMYYNEHYGVPRENLLFVQNYLPHYLFGGYYHENTVAENFEKNQKKPRVGIIGSPSHFNMKGEKDEHGNLIPDDFSVIADYVRKTVDKFQWVVFSTKIPAIIDLIDSGKVEYHDGCDMLSYPAAIAGLNLQAIVSPLQDNVFNRCKSNLKVIEPWALGVVPLVQDLPNYSRYTDSVFKDADMLDAKLTDVLGSEDKFMDTVKANYEKMPTWWLENHFRDWLDIFMMRRKNEVVSYDRIKSEIEAKDREAANDAASKVEPVVEEVK